MSDDLILLGYVAKAFGTKGAVHIKLFNPESNALAVHATVTLKLGDKAPRELVISEVVHGGRVYFEGITDRTTAELLQGAEVYMNRALLPDIEEDEFYLADLIGAQVILKGGEPAGILVAFSTNNAQTLLEVKTNSGHVASVPMVDAIVIDIDEDNKIITIDPPAGLLEPLD